MRGGVGAGPDDTPAGGDVGRAQVLTLVLTPVRQLVPLASCPMSTELSWPRQAGVTDPP